MTRSLATCLVVVTRTIGSRRHVLLGEKRRGFGVGRVVVPGGKIDAGETPRAAAVRELAEETALRVQGADLVARGVLDFTFPDGGGPRMSAAVFLVDEPGGEPTSTDELDVLWAPVDALPRARMWPDTPLWLPHALDGTLGGATFTYASDGATLTHAAITEPPART